MYYDSVIWAAYFLGKDDHHYESSRRLIRLIEDGEKRAIVSYLLIMETIHVIRTRIARRLKGSNAARIMDEALKTSRKFKEYVTNGVSSGKLILTRSDGIPGHDRKVYDKVSSMKGSIRGEKYQDLGHADVEHAYLADYGGASEFHTLDLGFRALNGDPDFAVKFVVHESGSGRDAAAG